VHLERILARYSASLFQDLNDTVDPNVNAITELLSGLDAYSLAKQSEVDKIMDELVQMIQDIKVESQKQINENISAYKTKLTDFQSQLVLHKENIESLYKCILEGSEREDSNSHSMDRLLETIRMLEKFQLSGIRIKNAKLPTQPTVEVKCNLDNLKRAMENLIQVEDQNNDFPFDEEMKLQINKLQTVLQQYWIPSLTEVGGAQGTEMKENKKKSPQKTPQKTPKKKPQKTPQKTQQKTPQKTPKKTPKKTPQKTPQKTQKTPLIQEAEEENTVANTEVERPENEDTLTEGPNTSRVFGSRGTGPLQFIWPQGVAVLPAKPRIVVCDRNNNRLQIVTFDGKHVRTVGPKVKSKSLFGRRKIQLKTPY